MTEKLPKGWKSAQIGKLCNLINGKAFKPEDWKTSGLPIIRIQNLNNKTAAFNYFEGVPEPKHLVQNGQLLFAWSGTPGTSFGAHVWTGPTGVLNQHIFKIEFDEKILDKVFFRHAINQKLDELINIAQGGVGLRHVTKGKFENTQINFPPIEEQKRIVARLDRLLARVDSCRAHLDRAAAAIKRFRQSVLNAAVTGDLSKNWRREFSTSENIDVFLKSLHNKETGSKRIKQTSRPNDTLSVKDSEKQFEIAETWRWLRIQQIALKMSTGPFGSMLHKKDYVANGIPVINPTNIQADRIQPSSKMMVCSDTMKRLARYCLSENDVVIARRGDLSKCAVVTNKESGWLCGTGSFFLKVGINPDYFRIFYISEFCQTALLADAIGSTMVNLNQKVLANIPIPVPPIQEQLEIVKLVKKLNDYADQFESRLTAARQRVDNLTASILAKAFRGELVAASSVTKKKTETSAAF